MLHHAARFALTAILLLIPALGLAVERTVLLEEFTNGW
jgi:hypothetical protein